MVLLADAIVMAVGVRVATDFLKDSGFTLERDGSLSVDEYLRVPGRDNVYAIGTNRSVSMRDVALIH